VLVALLVLALHALLLLGLPHWMRTAPAAGDTPVFQFRTIVPEPPRPTAPEPTKPPPKPKPKPKPKPRPESRPAPDSPPPPPVEPPSAAPIPTTSLLQAPPRAVFGGTMPPLPIVPPLPPDQTAAVVQQAAQPASSAEPDAGAPDLPGAIRPVQPPRSANLTYQTTVTQAGRQVTLPSTIVWQRDEQYYKLSWDFYGPAIGDRGRQVTGLLTARGLAPVTAQAMGAGGYHLTFDYAQSRLRGPSPQPASAPETAGTPLQPGAQDPFGAWLQLAALIAGDPAQYPVGSRIGLPIASEGEEPGLRATEFIVADERDLELTGELANQHSPALHLVHEPAGDQDTRIELWLGKRLDYLPIRLLISPPAGGGDRIEMTLRQAQLLRPPLSSAPASPASGDESAR